MPIIIGIGSLLLGVVLLVISLKFYGPFFRRRPYLEAARPTALEEPPVTEAVATEADAPGGAG